MVAVFSEERFGGTFVLEHHPALAHCGLGSGSHRPWGPEGSDSPRAGSEGPSEAVAWVGPRCGAHGLTAETMIQMSN